MPTPTIIPTPWSQHWREFRIRFVPLIVVAAAAIATITLWQGYIFPASLVGRAEAVQCPVASPKPGIISRLYVTRFQKVSAGDPIADISITDTNVAAASLAVIRAEIDLLKAGVNPVTIWQRTAIDYDQLRLNLLQQRAQLAASRVNLQLAETEFQRTSRLHQEKLVSDAEFEIARNTREVVRTQTSEEEQIVKEMSQALAQLAGAASQAQDPTNQLRAALRVQEEKLKLAEAELRPITLRAPTNGMVVLISQYSGETVLPGGRIVTISTLTSERIIGYLRQPLYLKPELGMKVRVRTRSFKRMGGEGEILAIGSQMQPINDLLLPPTHLAVGEEGLPVLVSMPDTLRSPPGAAPKVQPGELLDLTILPDPKRR
jgi:multidrug resistance efflux pump